MTRRHAGKLLSSSPEGQWALAVAWWWAVEMGLVGGPDTPAPPRVHGAPRSHAMRVAETWECLREPISWPRINSAVPAGVRGVARVLMEDWLPVGALREDWRLPSYWRTATVRREAGEWQVIVGLGDSTLEAGTWPTREAALAAARALRPEVREEA